MIAPKKNSAFTLVEIIVSSAILVFILGGLFFVFQIGNMTWAQAELSIRLQQDVRYGMNKIIRELRESGCENTDHNPPNICQSGEYKVEIFDATGTGNTDILRFSMYVECKDATHDIERWAAPLRWACKDAVCLDENDDCDTLEYSKVEYLVNASQQLIRRVLDNANTVLREDIAASDIQDFQVSRNADLITVQITVQGTDICRRQATYSSSNQVFLRNLLKD